MNVDGSCMIPATALERWQSILVVELSTVQTLPKHVLRFEHDLVTVQLSSPLSRRHVPELRRRRSTLIPLPVLFEYRLRHIHKPIVVLMPLYRSHSYFYSNYVRRHSLS